MKNLKTILASAAAGLVALSFAASVSAAPVVCGNAILGLRTVTVDPALVGGFCYAQNGNFAGDDFSVTGLAGTVVIDKDVVPGAPASDLAEGALFYTVDATGAAGTFAYDATLWDTFDRLFLAFHFGGAGSTPDTDPDSFFVELDILAAASGTWFLSGQLTGLSNIYLVGIPCVTGQPCNPELDVPEPGTVALLALGLLGLAYRVRRNS